MGEAKMMHRDQEGVQLYDGICMSVEEVQASGYLFQPIHFPGLQTQG